MVGRFAPVIVGGFAPVMVGGFVPVMVGGFAPVMVGGFAPVMVGGFAPIILKIYYKGTNEIKLQYIYYTHDTYVHYAYCLVNSPYVLFASGIPQ